MACQLDGSIEWCFVHIPKVFINLLAHNMFSSLSILTLQDVLPMRLAFGGIPFQRSRRRIVISSQTGK